MRKILIIEDDPSLTELIRAELDLAGYCPVGCADSSDALFNLQTEDFDLILLDFALRDPEATELMARLCGRETPVIFLVDGDNFEEQEKSQRLGADGWIGKPPGIREMLTRIEAALRQNDKRIHRLRYHDIEMDLPTRSVRQNGSTVRLTPKEFDLLSFFIQHVDVALSRERILQMVWGYCIAGETRTVDMHIMQLRKKLDFHQKLKSVIKVGYRLDH